jgi:hypothetical protein
MLAEKTNESDAILAKHVFVFLSCPDSLGRPGARGAALKASETVFRRVQGRWFVPFKRRSRQSTGEIENRNPPGLELAREAAERGITLNQLITPDASEVDKKGTIQCRQRLGWRVEY